MHRLRSTIYLLAFNWHCSEHTEYTERLLTKAGAFSQVSNSVQRYRAISTLLALRGHWCSAAVRSNTTDSRTVGRGRSGQPTSHPRRDPEAVWRGVQTGSKGRNVKEEAAELPPPVEFVPPPQPEPEPEPEIEVEQPDSPPVPEMDLLNFDEPETNVPVRAPDTAPFWMQVSQHLAWRMWMGAQVNSNYAGRF